MSDRRNFVAGNWKMNTDRAGAVALAEGVADLAAGEGWGCEVGVIPPFVYLDAVGAALRAKGSKVRLGAQDMYPGENGAFTGEISAAMLKDLGVDMVLVGHSERRHVIGEGEDVCAAKVRAVLGAGLTCVLCIGEKLEEREAGQTDAVNERQLRSGLAGIGSGQAGKLVIAYEPVWAIGTGKVASPEDAQAAHKAVRGVLADIFDAGTAAGIRIQYGGSMKPENAAELLAQPDIDGGLIGGAALQADSFGGICRAAG